MFFYALFSLASPLLGLVLIAWAVLTIWRTVTLPRSTPREPACEQCKYPVTGLVGVAGFTCPECGSDLLHVGITTPRMEATRRGSLAAAILAWTFLCGAGGYVAMFISIMFIGFGSAMSAQSATTTWSQTLTPKINVYRSIELVYESDWQSLASEMDIVITLADGTEHILTLDPGPMSITGLDGGDAAWDADTVDTWFAELGLDMTDLQITAAAAETSRVIDLTIMSPGNGYTLNLTNHTNSFQATGGAMAAGFATGNTLFDNVALWLGAFAVGVLLYVLGIVMIVMRRRRLVQRVITPT